MHGHQHNTQAHATWWVDRFKLDIPKFQGDLQPEEFMDRVATVGEVLDFKEVPEDRRVSLVATKLIDEDLSVDWASPPIYDIYPDEDGLLEEVNLVLDTINIVEGNNTYLVFEESPKSEKSQWGLEKINYVDFLRVETFLSTFPEQNLDVGVGMVKEIGLNNFKYNTRAMTMMKSIAFIGGCCFVLVLKMGKWNELTGHLKDHEKNLILSNLGRMMQIGGPTAVDRPNGDLAIRTLCYFYALFMLCLSPIRTARCPIRMYSCIYFI
jgi:hypothetical protein